MAGSRAGCLAVRDFFCLYNRAESGLGGFFNVCNVSIRCVTLYDFTGVQRVVLSLQGL